MWGSNAHGCLGLGLEEAACAHVAAPQALAIPPPPAPSTPSKNALTPSAARRIELFGKVAAVFVDAIVCLVFRSTSVFVWTFSLYIYI